MAKKKEIETIEVIEEIAEAVEEPKEEIVDTEAENLEKFIMNKLKVINRFDNQAKAKRLAKRILDNRKGK